MAILYNFPSIVPSTNTWELQSNSVIFTSPLSRTSQVLELPGTRWAATLNFSDLDRTEKSVLNAFLSQMRGPASQFRLHDHSYPGTSGNVAGTIVVEPNALVTTNGGFDTDTDWTKGTGWTIANGVATHAPGTASTLYFTVSSADLLQVGLPYKIQFEITAWTAGSVWSYLSTDSTPTLTKELNANQLLTYTFEISSLSSASTLEVGINCSADFDGSIDNFKAWLRDDYIICTGWSATTSQTILYAGDYIEIDPGELKIVISDVISDGTGVQYIQIEPPLHSIRTAQANAVFNEPSVKMRLLDDSQLRWSNKEAGLLSDITINCIEVI